MEPDALQPAFGSIFIWVYVYKPATFYESFGVIFSIRTDNNIYVFNNSSPICRLKIPYFILKQLSTIHKHKTPLSELSLREGHLSLYHSLPKGQSTDTFSISARAFSYISEPGTSALSAGSTPRCSCPSQPATIWQAALPASSPVPFLLQLPGRRSDFCFPNPVSWPSSGSPPDELTFSFRLMFFIMQYQIKAV